jgi:Protein of unknown function (DUF1569)
MKSLSRSRDRDELIQRLRRLRADSTRRWGRMSAHQMVCHLNDSLLVATGQRAVSHAISLPSRTIIKWIALYLPLRWPPGILTRPEIDQEAGGTTPIDFAADVARQVTLLEDVARQPQTLRGSVHPIFGRLSERTWLRWAYLHTDHHLRQFGT